MKNRKEKKALRPAIQLKLRAARAWSILKEQALSYLISLVIGVSGTVVLFHYTSQPTRSAEVREKLVGMAQKQIEKKLATRMASVTLDSVTVDSLDLSTSNSVVVYGSAVSTDGDLSRFLMVFEPSSQGVIDKIVGRAGFYGIGYWAIIADAGDDEVVVSSVSIEDLDGDGNKDILVRLKSTYADGVSKGLLVLKKDAHDLWHLMGLPSMTKIMHSTAAGHSPLPEGLRPATAPIRWFSDDKRNKHKPDVRRYADWEVDEFDWEVADPEGSHSLWMIRNGTKIEMLENKQAGYKHFGVLANIHDYKAIQGPHHLMVSFFRIEDNKLVLDQNWNWAYSMFSIGMENSQNVELEEMQQAGLSVHVSGNTVFGLTEFGRVDTD